MIVNILHIKKITPKCKWHISEVVCRCSNSYFQTSDQHISLESHYKLKICLSMQIRKTPDIHICMLHPGFCAIDFHSSRILPIRLCIKCLLLCGIWVDNYKILNKSNWKPIKCMKTWRCMHTGIVVVIKSHLSLLFPTSSKQGTSSMAGSSESPYRLGRDTRLGLTKGLGVGRQGGWVLGLFL